MPATTHEHQISQPHSMLNRMKLLRALILVEVGYVILQIVHASVSINPSADSISNIGIFAICIAILSILYLLILHGLWVGKRWACGALFAFSLLILLTPDSNELVRFSDSLNLLICGVIIGLVLKDRSTIETI